MVVFISNLPFWHKPINPYLGLIHLTRKVGTLGGSKRDRSRLVLMFLKDESGAAAIEYELIAAGIAIAIITAVQGVGSKRSSNFSSISTSLK